MGRIFKDAEIFCKKRPPVASGGTMGKIELFGRSSQLNGFFPGSLELHVGHIADFKLRMKKYNLLWILRQMLKKMI